MSLNRKRVLNSEYCSQNVQTRFKPILGIVEHNFLSTRGKGKDRGSFKYYTVKMYLVVKVYIHSFFIFTLDGGDLLSSYLDRFTNEERAFDTDWIKGWVDFRAGS